MFKNYIWQTGIEVAENKIKQYSMCVGPKKRRAMRRPVRGSVVFSRFFFVTFFAAMAKKVRE
jgi:hypothetical protein